MAFKRLGTSLIKILASIIIALVLLILISSLIIWVIDVPDYRSMQSVMVPTIIAVFGFIMYGIQGVLWWWIVQTAMIKWLPQWQYHNLISATIASVLSCLTLPVIMQDISNHVLFNALSMMVAVWPVAMVAVLLHYVVFVRNLKSGLRN